MKYDQFVIYSDYDLTLTNRHDILEDANRMAASAFIHNGGHFAIATGRGEKDVSNMHIDHNAPSIMHNGALIACPQKKVLHEVPINQNDIKKACIDLFHRFDKLGLFLFTGEVFCMRTVDHQTGRIQNHMTAEEAVTSAEKTGRRIVNLCLDSYSSVTDQASAYLNANYPSLQAVYSGPGHMDVLPGGVSKGSAIRWLKDNLFNHGETIIAVGDNVNDIAMLEAADIGMAVGNALPEVKQKADYILPDCDTPCLDSIMRVIDSRLL